MSVIFVQHNHKTIQEAINEQPIEDLQVYNLGEDRDGNQYLHFPQFCGQDVRIYRQSYWDIFSPKETVPNKSQKSKYTVSITVSGICTW